MALNGATLAEGMAVIGPEAEQVGEVKQVRDGTFVVGRTLQPAVEVPFEVIQTVLAHEVHLSIGAEEVDELYWVHAGEDMRVETRGEYD